MQNFKQLVAILIKRNSLQMTCSFFYLKEKENLRFWSNSISSYVCVNFVSSQLIAIG